MCFNQFSKKEIILAALTYLFLVVLLRLEAIQLFSTHIIGGTNGDIGIYLYLSKILPEIGLNSPSWFDLPVMYPYGKVLAWTDNFILPTAVIFLFQKILLSFVESFNLTILLFSFLNGFLSYLAARSLNNSQISSLWLGTAIQCSSFLTLHLGHPQLQCLFFIPLGILSAQSSKPLTAGALSGVTFLAAFLSGIYIAFFTAIVILVWGIVVRKQEFLKFSVGAFLVGTLALPFLYPYAEVSKAFGGREVSEGYEFAANVKSYLSAPALSIFYGSTSSFSHPEAQFFMGWGFLFAVLVGLYVSGGVLLLLFFGIMISLQSYYSLITTLIPFGVFFVKKDKITKSVVFLFLLFFSLSIGSIKGETTLHSIFSENFPFIGSLRATGRFGLAAMFFGGLLGSFALSRLHWSISVSLLIAAYFEQKVSAFALEPYIFNQSVSRPTQTKTGAVVLPFVNEINEQGQIKSWQDFAKLQLNQINNFSDPSYVLMNGYSGLQGKVTQPLARSLYSFPSEVSIKAIRKTLGINTVISPNKVSSDYLELLGENKSSFEYKVLDIKFDEDITLIAPPWAKEASLLMGSSENCSVKFEFDDKNIVEKNLTSKSSEILLDLPSVNPQVGARRIKLSKNGCNNYTIGDTKVLRGDYIVK